MMRFAVVLIVAVEVKVAVDVTICIFSEALEALAIFLDAILNNEFLLRCQTALTLCHVTCLLSEGPQSMSVRRKCDSGGQCSLS